jgi:hypothetical protein
LALVHLIGAGPDRQHLGHDVEHRHRVRLSGDNFDNATQMLTFAGGSTLTTLGSGFCLGLGATGAFTGNFKVTVPPSPIILL